MKTNYTLSIFAALTLLALILINITSIYLVGPYAWDDGAITLAFAKTLAENGQFSLTLASEIVEGTSSLLFAFLMASLHFIFEFDFATFISVSQIIAFVFLISTAIVVHSKIVQSGVPQSFSITIVALFFLLPMFTSEVMNGMEMTLFAFLVTLYYVYFLKNNYLVMLLTPLILLTRFEAIFYLGFSIFIFFLIFERKRRSLFIGLYTIAIFMLITACRWYYFGDIFPNTIWAKMNTPYSSDGLRGIYYKIMGGVDFLKVSFWLLIPVAIVLFTPLRAYLRNDIGVLLIISYAIFGLITGKNWGYDGRMFVSILPVIVLLIVSITSKINGEGPIVVTFSRQNLVSLEKNILLFTIFFGCIMATHITKASLHYDNIKFSLVGGSYLNRLPPEIKLFVDRHLARSDKTWFGVTPENYRLTGTAVDGIRKAIDRDTISFMVPDVGGVGLCCSKIKVIDSALLTNRELAKSGYGVFDEYLSKTLPDVIETHAVWSRVSKIYESQTFVDNYRPIVFENNLLWVHSDILSLISASPLVSKNLISNIPDLKEVRYGWNSTTEALDVEYLTSMELTSIVEFNYVGR